MKTIQLLLATILVTIFAASAQEEVDDVAECAGWADAGECSLNPRYMLEQCPIACARVAENDKLMAEEIGECMLRYRTV